MPSRLKYLVSKGLATPALNGLEDMIQYESYVGSSVYGVTSDTSDLDVISFAIPQKDIVFPHLAGYINGFGDRPRVFETYQQHHMVDTSALGGDGREYDYTSYNIVKYFDLLMGGNPTLIDSLFVPLKAILFVTPIGQMVRDCRHLFLHKGCFHKFRGYSFQQLHKMRIKKPTDASKRKEMVDTYGYDLKFGLHVVRLLLQCEQILVEGDLDLERNNKILKSIRNGEWKLEQIESYFRDNEQRLFKIYDDSKLPYAPPVDKIKLLLLNCLETHFGSLKDCITTVDPAIEALNSIQDILHKYNLRK